MAAMGGCKSDIFHNDRIRLNAEAFPGVGAAKRAFVSRASHGDLEQDTVRLAGGPDDIPFIVHVPASIIPYFARF